MKALVLAALLLADSDPIYVWFNLVEFTPEHKWRYVDTTDTLEECQALRVQYEADQPGNYYCFPARVFKS